MKNKNLIVFLLFIVLFTACKKQSSASGPGSRFGAREETVIIEVAELRDLNEFIRLTGVLEGKIDINFNSEVSGQIIELFKGLGDNIRKGEAIGRIDNRDFEIQVAQAQAAVLSAEATLLSAESAYNANKRLHEGGRLSEVEYQNSVSIFKNAQAQLQGAKATLEARNRTLQNSQFISPVDGQIVDLPIRVGQTITVGQKVAGIVDLSTLKIRTGVGESAIKTVYRGQSVNITHRSMDEVIIGRVTGVGQKPLANIATYPIEIEINNRDRKLLPGLVVNCEILSFINKNVIYTLTSNVQKEYDTDFVYVVDSENIVHKKVVKLGKQISENIIIESGVNVGDRILTDGHDRVREGSKVIVK